MKGLLRPVILGGKCLHLLFIIYLFFTGIRLTFVSKYAEEHVRHDLL